MDIENWALTVFTVITSDLKVKSDEKATPHYPCH